MTLRHPLVTLWAPRVDFVWVGGAFWEPLGQLWETLGDTLGDPGSDLGDFWTPWGTYFMKNMTENTH